ncbi:MAG: hypothetical protein AAF194_05490, partial [Pseudomonadota bacterium]
MDNDQEESGGKEESSGKTVVCYVCRKYFLDIDCTETEFDGFICHECSGEKPVAAETEPQEPQGTAPKTAPEKTKDKAEGAGSDAKSESLMAPG